MKIKLWWPLYFASWIMKCSAISLYSFLHYNIGIRFISPLTIFVSSFFLFLYVKFSVNFVYLYSEGFHNLDYVINHPFSIGYDEFNLLYRVAYISVGLSICHFLYGLIRYKKGYIIHSRYCGTPFLCLLGLNHDFVVKYLEPLIFTGIGMVFLYVKEYMGFGVWFLMGGISMFIELKLSEYFHFIQVVNALDNKIESEHLQNALVDKISPRKTQGYYIPTPNFMRPEQRKSLADILKKSGLNAAPESL